jgi:hypothetical protein
VLRLRLLQGDAVFQASHQFNPIVRAFAEHALAIGWMSEANVRHREEYAGFAIGRDAVELGSGYAGDGE